MTALLAIRFVNIARVPILMIAFIALGMSHLKLLRVGLLVTVLVNTVSITMTQHRHVSHAMPGATVASVHQT